MKVKDEDDFKGLWDAIPEDAREELAQAVERSGSEEEFISEIFVGECPKCGSRKTKDCDEDPEIDDVTVGLCKACGYLWCTECGRPVTKGVTCEHWAICEECMGDDDEFDDCGIPSWECDKISVFEEPVEEELLSCAWCGEIVEPGAEVFALGAKARKGMGLKKFEGTIIPLGLTHSGRSVPAMIATRDSEAKKQGNDIMFLVCGRKCGEALKKALQKEKFTTVHDVLPS
jgi:hypothetical protein